MNLKEIRARIDTPHGLAVSRYNSGDVPYLLKALDNAQPFVEEIAARWDEELIGEHDRKSRTQARAWMWKYFQESF